MPLLELTSKKRISWLLDPGNQPDALSRPLAFLIPPAQAKDHDGNAPGQRVRRPLRALSRCLNEIGFSTFRYVLQSAGEESELSAGDHLEIFEKAIQLPEISKLDLVLVGFRDGADLIAKHYYDFFSRQSPGAAILLSPTASNLYLNNLTCPYLMLHGTGDSLFHTTPYSRFLDAIHHHQQRYGDGSVARLVPQMDKELGDQTLSPLVLEEIGRWIKSELKAGMRRPQERAA